LKRLLREIDVLFSGEECERKFLVSYPDLTSLENSPFANQAHIIQTYLLSDADATERVRRRERNGEVIYTHTVKRRIDRLTSEEQESQIDALQYRALLCRADPSKTPIEKTRYCILHQGHYFELDVYPFWRDRAIVELELSERSDEEICFPPQIRLIREVTDDVRYKNVRLAIEVPFDEITEA
jgi:CYTH domain-containing protein